jgi:hypothetical protein
LQEGNGFTIKQTSKSTVDRKRYQTRIVSMANRVELKFMEALAAIVEGFAKSIARIF